MHFKMSSAKWHPFCLGLNVLKWWQRYSCRPTCDERPLRTRFLGPTWGPYGTDRTQVGPMLAPWTLLSGTTLCLWRAHIPADIARPPHEPQLSYPAPQGWLVTLSTPLSCGMSSCWQINSILVNSGSKNSIQILNQYPFLWKILIWA